MPNIDKDVQKEVLKEALTEWLDKQFASFGKWAMRSVLAAAFSALMYLYLTSQGWHK
ncbi:hypothetical protein [Ralstonia phage P-PSG-11-1]|uniref:Uncharacterized protein n=1 Tax=Ralstonia phage P-PSG-11 TaxID=2652430 RepID=A0A5P8D3R8_9CAUD|nr:hypothetical protein [Ralstonia phage P-PSG-11]QFP93735.1 hypothetical protein [Ralstonia phage P-PSG-11-1]